MLIDCHVHLQESAFEEDLDAVMARAVEVGVEAFVCNGTCEGDWPRVAEIAERYGNVIPCFGLHPWHADERSPAWMERLREFMRRSGAGLGEIGLDRLVRDRDEKDQEKIFRLQLRLAVEMNRPAMIHCLKSWGWLARILQEEGAPSSGFLLHAYGGSRELIERFAGMGGYFSFAGSVLEERKTRQQEALRAVPRDRLLLETDAPAILPPEPFRERGLPLHDGGPRNEPANLKAIVKGVASLLDEEHDGLIQRLAENSRRFFLSLWPEAGP